jgi:hypothetical protein
MNKNPHPTRILGISLHKYYAAQILNVDYFMNKYYLNLFVFKNHFPQFMLFKIIIFEFWG